MLSRGTTLHPQVFELLYDAAQQEGIAFTIESQGRSTGTDADAIHATGAGIPTGVVSVPLRYMHTPVEMVAIQDVEDAARLIAAVSRRLTSAISFER